MLFAASRHGKLLRAGCGARHCAFDTLRTIDTAKAFGERLQLVGFVPTLLAATVVMLMVGADAPRHALSWTLLVKTIRSLGAVGGAAASAVAVALAITLQPLQFRLVQTLEGYWSPRAPVWLFKWGVSRQLRVLRAAEKQLTVQDEGLSPLTLRYRLERAQWAGATVQQRFPTDDRLLPTGLGNVLRSAEDRAGLRYGVDSVTLWPRLFPLLPPDFSKNFEDEVTQLDVSARLAVTWSIAGLACLILLVTDVTALAAHPAWLGVPGSLFVLGRLSYRAAVESALAHGVDVEVALDLFRERVLAAARLPEARRLAEERQQFGVLCDLLATYEDDHDIDFAFRH
ncbi:hypothetical protein acdb102_32870 [Acidothermaceae bacterium B102]|nr:hypothetical protein acdb102_32870 [Acidothermaceae bacterium B102]